MLCIPCEHDVAVMRDTRDRRVPHPACDRCCVDMTGYPWGRDQNVQPDERPYDTRGGLR